MYDFAKHCSIGLLIEPYKIMRKTQIQSSEDFMAQKIGKYIKYQRSKRKLSLNAFADTLELDPSFLMHLENGDYNTLKLDMVEKIASGLHMTMGDFLWKCQILNDRDRTYIPELDFYLREKFQFPDDAIEDVKLYLKLIKEKYGSK